MFGGISIFPINSDGSLGTPINQQMGVGPVGVTVANFNTTVYVANQGDLNSSPVIQPIVQAFTANATTGALTPIAGNTTETVGSTERQRILLPACSRAQSPRIRPAASCM